MKACSLTAPVKLTSRRPVPDRGFQLVGRDGQDDRFLARGRTARRRAALRGASRRVYSACPACRGFRLLECSAMAFLGHVRRPASQYPNSLAFPLTRIANQV